jgi:hypothetical protein
LVLLALHFSPQITSIRGAESWLLAYFQQSIAMTSITKANNYSRNIMSPSPTNEVTRRMQKNPVPALVPSQVIHGTYAHSKRSSEKVTSSYHNTTILSEDAIKNWILLGTLNAKIKAQQPSLLFVEDDKSPIFTVNSIEDELHCSNKPSQVQLQDGSSTNVDDFATFWKTIHGLEVAPKQDKKEVLSSSRNKSTDSLLLH